MVFINSSRLLGNLHINNYQSIPLMQFIFYHGTSSLFLPSILKNGLGGINPSIELKTLELLEYLFNDAEKHLTNNQEYLLLQKATYAMVNQSSIRVKTKDDYEQTCHFTHQNIYVALSEYRAVVHAVMNAYGSEIVSRCVKIYALLKKAIPNYHVPQGLNLIEIDSIVSSQNHPIIIKIKGTDVNEELIEKEDGKTAKEALDFLRRTIPLLPDQLKPEFLQHCNFQLLSPIPKEKLRVYKIRYTGNFNNDFDYHLVPVGNSLL